MLAISFIYLFGLAVLKYNMLPNALLPNSQEMALSRGDGCP